MTLAEWAHTFTVIALPLHVGAMWVREQRGARPPTAFEHTVVVLSGIFAVLAMVAWAAHLLGVIL